MKKSILVRRIVYIILCAILVFADQFTKWLATNKLMNKDPFVIIDNVLEFNYLDGGNNGVAWGLFSGNITIFIILTIILLGIFVFIINKLDKLIKSELISASKAIILQLTIVILISGAIGNFIDRFINGYVVDFIYFKLINFPLFNFADCCITVSVIFMFLLIIFKLNDEEFELIFSLKSNKKEAGGADE